MKTKRGTEMARFRMPRFNSDLKAYFSHFKKGIFTILGIVLIGGLIVASFIYGTNEQNREEQNQTAQSEQSETDQSVASDEQASESGEENVEGATGDEDPVPFDEGESNSGSQATDDQATNDQASDSQSSSASTNDSGKSTKGKSGMPAKGPKEVVNTGPEDWAAPLAATAGYLLWRKYRTDKKAFAEAFLK